MRPKAAEPPPAAAKQPYTWDEIAKAANICSLIIIIWTFWAVISMLAAPNCY
jgi:hypothetical protein